MSGDDQSERGTPPDGMRARAAKAEAPRTPSGGPPPLPPEQAPAAAPAARVKKAQPPPGIITAGGVDMARGHARNIQPKALGDAQTPAVPRVVVSVETDPRRARTMPRLSPGRAPADGKPSPWGAVAVEVVDKRDLPSANLPVTAPAPVAAQEEKKKKGGVWLRYAVVLVLLLLAAGIVRRVRMASGPDTSGTPQRTIAVAPPLPPEATADPTAAAATPRPRHQGGALAAGTDPAVDLNAAAEADLLDAGLDPDAFTDSEELDAAVPRPRVAPPPPKPTFKPLFELPQEKAKESP